MKYIIDLVEDIRQNIQNSKEYTLVAMLLREDAKQNLQNAGEKVITSFHLNHDTKELQFGFMDSDVTTKDLLECVNSLEMHAMMYSVVLKISNQHPLMSVIGFGENHEEKKYIFFVSI